MAYDFNRQWLTKKFGEIRKRLLKAIEQLSEEQLNWSPDDSSHTIADLLRHIEGNVNERIRKGIQHEKVGERDQEFTKALMSKSEAEALISRTMDYILELLDEITDEKLEEVQQVRGKARTNLDMLHQCAAHYSEHMGQIFYIAKLCLKDGYVSTSV
ncbi:DinB family protein [Paenibacillus daejeonensis]|uniref:DinB family protein n=1 Tax=Paenibacillus daejeonensis TaxID=135193 RepID=UPI0003604EFB|nr:DinB family protein [Paenibacillus daejeonensis]